MKKLVVFSGAGMSAESGLKTFRDSGGLWEEYDIYKVATPEAFEKDPELVLKFYNMRRAQLANAEPNEAHIGVASLEEKYSVDVVTQNVDDLHERAGSTRVLHLHGELRKVRSVKNPDLRKDIAYKDIKLGDLAEDGGQWRPDVVWFGEAVPMMDSAIAKVAQADILVIIGTSLNVYPAAGLASVAGQNCKKYLIDPNADGINVSKDVFLINEKAGTGMSRLLEILNRGF
ncbi:MAG: NAD-dependent deacylase [Flavobacteriales bacterium]|nr:NAD-dependent deacylase [Flavobacteriales bacterium]